jgi:hypothetical protein
MKGRPASTGVRLKTESCEAAIETVALRLIGDAASRNGCPTPLHAYRTPRLAAQHPLRFRQVRLHGACRHQVSTLMTFLHCDLVRNTFVAKLGVRLQIRAKSLYQLFEVIQFLKILNPIVRGQFSLGQTLQVIALGQKDTSPCHTQDFTPQQPLSSTS